MSPACTYRCLNCLEHVIERDFDVSHLSVTCPECDSFERFVNEGVYEQYRTFEESPPESLEWDRLSRTEKLVVCERVVRTDTAVEDFEVSE